MRFLILFLFCLYTPALSSTPTTFDEPFVRDQDTYLLTNSSSWSDNTLLKRNDNCPVNYNSCSTLAAGYGGACCASGYLCTTDAARQIACCTIGAKCTGKLDQPTSQTTAAGGITIVAPAATPTSTTSAPATQRTVSIVPNVYFPFPYIPTTYPDRTACLSAYSACQTNYAACAANLQGTSYGVTIIAPAGGITVSPTVQDLGVTRATDICSSLSSQACYGIARSDCNEFTAGFVVSTGTIVGGQNAVAKPTVGAFATAGIMAGMGLGLMGQIA
ncbi:hypothetical protein K3495_g3921 [Podosphaera aphanis]|nr:hypothetical protein K3495_g3921 [Podosphaera aphanis]